MYTAYELMQRRFGPNIRKLTAGSFLLLRSLAEGVRVFAISIVISIILGTGEMSSILLIVALTLFYTFEGGMEAVIWTTWSKCSSTSGAPSSASSSSSSRFPRAGTTSGK